MANQLNSGSIDTLKKGDTLLVNARKVANGKIQLEFAEIINSNTKGVNVLALLNKSDDRFSSNARRAWMTAEPTDAAELLGINLGANQPWYASDKGDMLDLYILNPSMYDTRMRVIVNETTEPTEYQAENLERSAKRRGKEGEFITHNGDYIFSNTDVVLSNDNTEEFHVFLESDNTGLKTKVAAATNADAFDELI